MISIAFFILFCGFATKIDFLFVFVTLISQEKEKINCFDAFESRSTFVDYNSNFFSTLMETKTKIYYQKAYSMKLTDGIEFFFIKINFFWLLPFREEENDEQNRLSYR